MKAEVFFKMNGEAVIRLELETDAERFYFKNKFAFNEDNLAEAFVELKTADIESAQFLLIDSK